MFVIRGRLAPEVGEVLMKALDAAGEKLHDSSREQTDDVDRPPVGKLRADALGLVAESALAGELDPGGSGDRYQVVVHVNEAELATPEAGSVADCCRASVSAEAAEGAVSAEAVDAGVSAETARRIGCDAGKVPMSHRNGEILSVGRKTRTIPPPIRRALAFRDRGCRFPGCTSRHCDAHHLHHWADGGETRLSNLVLLCRRHHRLLHEGGFEVRMAAAGAVQFFHPRGRPLHESPTPSPVGPYPARISFGIWKTPAFSSLAASRCRPGTAGRWTCDTSWSPYGGRRPICGRWWNGSGTGPASDSRQSRRRRSRRSGRTIQLNLLTAPVHATSLRSQ